ncbi:MAG: iron-sulfur cluster-binding domain-containing protein, partial [Neisseriaceae bacterium]|nr:iron-sulfur cluster-binding domain-containing protein [Neisseriaceae bacterium]
WFNYGLRPKEIVIFSKPYGEFQWPNNNESVLLLAAGSGITPIISLLRENINNNQPIQLYYWNKTRSEACFVKELQNMQQSYDNFTFELHLTQEQAEQKHERHGRISQSIENNTPELSQSHVLACGPSAFIIQAKNLLATKSKTFLSESFSPPIFELDENEKLHDYTLTLQKQNKTIIVANNKPILDALLENGINHPYGCKMGICISCVCHKVSGKTKNALTDEVDIEENPALKICTEYAKSDVVLDV